MSDSHATKNFTCRPRPYEEREGRKKEREGEEQDIKRERKSINEKRKHDQQQYKEEDSQTEYANETTGPNDTETTAWVKAAGMVDFNTFYSRCKYALTEEEGFKWPEGVASIDYGFSGRERHGPIMRPR